MAPSSYKFNYLFSWIAYCFDPEYWASPLECVLGGHDNYLMRTARFELNSALSSGEKKDTVEV